MANEVDDKLVEIDKFSDDELAKFMKENGISLKIEEARSINGKIGRNPTLTELHIFNIEWSEHASYKSSKNILKLLPTSGSTVIQGPKEDAGILKFTTHKGDKYGVVIAHESHNHPSQVVPAEGAATGVGGIVRDVCCMGAKVICNLPIDEVTEGVLYDREKKEVEKKFEEPEVDEPFLCFSTQYYIRRKFHRNMNLFNVHFNSFSSRRAKLR